MEEGGGATAERHHEHGKSERSDRKINNVKLAAMLRESASFVDRGEFDPILYQALQDFRVYYKQHYPKKKDEKKKKSKSKKTPSTPEAEKRPTETVKTPAPTAEVDDTSAAQPTPMVRASSDTTNTTTTTFPSVTPEVPEQSTVPDSRESSMQSHDVFEQEMPTQHKAPPPPPKAPDMTGVGSRPQPSPPSATPKPQRVEAIPQAPATVPHSPTKISAAVFGNIKFPKFNVAMPNPTFAATSKKNAERAKEDLHAFNGVLAQHAESSRRRKAEGGVDETPDGNQVLNGSYENPSTTVGTRAGDQQEHAPPATTNERNDSSAQNSAPTDSSNAPMSIPTTTERSETATPADSGAARESHFVGDMSDTPPVQQQDPTKPDFQRPLNKASSLVANGWVEQQRRSKMRPVWKEVLASLVQGRRPGEETTLWIQREVSNPVTGKKELEALHQIPIKLLQKCTYQDYSADNRFTLKLYNSPEEFLFRCHTDIGAMNWVRTLMKHEQLAKGKAPASAASDASADSWNKKEAHSFEEEKKLQEQAPADSKRLSVGELRAICHGAGVNTAGMERTELEAAAEEVKRRGTYFPPPAGAPQQFPVPPPKGASKPQPAPTQAPPPSTQAPPATAPASAKMSVSELRAMCHGAGINTAGMERTQLEAAAAEVRKRGTYFPAPQGAKPTATPNTAPTQPQPSAPPAPQSDAPKLSVSDLRAICHGAGINTAGMERSQLEAAAEEVRSRGTFFPAPKASQTAVPSAQSSGAGPTPSAPPQPPKVGPTDGPAKISISDLRAICHGAGINTAGMERSQLEAAAEEVRKRGTFFEKPKPSTQPPSAAHDDPRNQEGEAKRQKAQETIRRAKEEYHRQQVEEEHRRQQTEGDALRQQAEEEHRRRQAEEEHRRRQEEERRRRLAEEEHRRRQAEEERRRQAEEELRRRQAEEERRRQAEEEHRRRLAEQEHQRRLAEQQQQQQHAADQQRRYAEQQAQWKKHQQEEEQRRRAAEQQAAEQRRQREEAVRKQQQWHQEQQKQQWQQQQQQQQQQWQQQQQQPPRPQQQQPQWQQHQQQQPQWQQHQQQQQARQPTPPPQHQHQHHQHPHSAVNEKYAKMANQSEDDGQAAITRIKHDLLVHWALQPPQLQMLRPIDMLVTTIHNVFPPALGVPSHDYFGKWKPLGRSDVCNEAGLPDEEKLKKAVRKIRFFLHPDKLPKDLNPEQAFMVKMLWDVTSDGWEEYEKGKEDLDWIK